MPPIPKLPFGDTLPRIIHRVHLGGELPDVLRANLEDAIRLNPGWRQITYGEEDVRAFIIEHYGRKIQDIYDRINPDYLAARSDLFRYLVVYRSGGVYLDTKSRIARPLDETLASDERFVISQWRNRPGEAHAGHGLHRELADVAGGEFQQWHVIACAGHPFLAAVIGRVLENIRTYRPWTGVGRNGVLRVTGPIPYTRAIMPLLDRYPHRRVRSEQEIGLAFSCIDHSPYKSTHYSERTSPVVRSGMISDLITRAFVQGRSVRNRLRG